MLKITKAGKYPSHQTQLLTSLEKITQINVL